MVSVFFFLSLVTFKTTVMSWLNLTRTALKGPKSELNTKVKSNDCFYWRLGRRRNSKIPRFNSRQIKRDSVIRQKSDYSCGGISDRWIHFYLCALTRALQNGPSAATYSCLLMLKNGRAGRRGEGDNLSVFTLRPRRSFLTRCMCACFTRGPVRVCVSVRARVPAVVRP